MKTCSLWSRSVALALVGCLLADPSLAAVSNIRFPPPPVQAARVNHQIFESQAFASRAVGHVQSLGPRIRSLVIRWRKQFLEAKAQTRKPWIMAASLTTLVVGAALSRYIFAIDDWVIFVMARKLASTLPSYDP